MIKIREAIVVEGRYDRHALKRLFDTVIVETHGFGIFTDREQLDYLRALALRRGLLVLTDSDGAGFLIRSYLKRAVPASRLKHAYIPEIAGKERRKDAPSKEGLLGVEGMRPQVLIAALRRAGATVVGETEAEAADRPVTKAEFYAAGLSGRPDSAARRRTLLARLGLPGRLTANGLLEAVNAMYRREDFFEIVAELDKNAEGGPDETERPHPVAPEEPDGPGAPRDRI